MREFLVALNSGFTSIIEKGLVGGIPYTKEAPYDRNAFFALADYEREDKIVLLVF